ncbi:hypothetical protein BDV25DRAFT_161685 [Aspergillus avenaceus]|uniref:Uncharacterized protein n=1 Tax=Aspergillus avenaceus TaxID=36643 RepID=A0A5N6TKI8_ASPAV|nr:hypothetical protein BDV25DRAFT_161685 [Aspergillus avenaceus]
MADSPKPLSRRPSITSSASHLRYPTFPPLSGSVEEWLSRSRPITNMTSTPPIEHTSRSLSGSWATLSVSDAHSEDGGRSEQTDIGSLIDQTAPDDVASLDGQYSGSELYENDGDEYDSKSIFSESPELPAPFPQIRGSIDDSNITTQTAFRQGPESIEFIEPVQWPESEVVELKHIMHMFEGTEAAELKEQFSSNFQDSVLTATVQQTMTKKSLDTDKPFRVLYIGDSDFRNIILDKMGDVLVSSTCSGPESSSTESSRYHVVPTSFGAGAIPNFAELLPIHVQLIVDECLKASTDLQSDRSNAIKLDFKNRPPCTSFWNGKEYCYSSRSEWKLPDVAIVFLSSRDSATAMEAQRLAHAFLERHGVPAMVISEKSMWKQSESIPLNPYSLHTSLEARHSSTGKTTVLRRYPIDLGTFESITPGQLNRNLASLVNICGRRSGKFISENPKLPPSKPLDRRGYTLKSTLIPSLSDYHRLAPMLRLTALSALLVAGILFGHSTIRLGTTLWSTNSDQLVATDVISVSSDTAPFTNIVPKDGLRRASFPVLSSSMRDAQLLGSKHGDNSHLGSLMAGSLPLEKQESGAFEVQVVGDCHLVIKPPSQILNGKSQPRFNVQVSRGTINLDHELSQLFDGVYTLKLDRGDAYGTVNVTITMGSKPPFSQISTVDLGTPWLKLSNWRRAAQTITSQLTKDFNGAQSGMSEVYTRLSTDLQVLMGDVVKRAHTLCQEADIFRGDSLQLSLDTKDLVLAKSKQLSEAVRRTAVHPILAASSVFQDQTKRVNRETRDLVSDTWHKFSDHTHGYDLKSMREHLRNARKCNALDRAQRNAKGLMRRQS